MPVEFQTGVWRIGHSMVRPSYRVNFTGQPAGQAELAAVLRLHLRPGAGERPRLGGHARRLAGGEALHRLADVLRLRRRPGPGLNPVRPNKRLDTIISSALFRLPLFTIASGDPPISLAERNLLRHLTWSLPSGQTLARVMDVSPLSSSEIGETGIGSIRSDFTTVDAALVLRPARGAQARGRAAARPGRRAHRRRGDHRPAQGRRGLGAERAQLQDAHPGQRLEPADGRHPQVRGGRRRTVEIGAHRRLRRPAGAGGAALSPCRRSLRRSRRGTARLAPAALLAQLVEHLHGKEGVDGSSPSEGSEKNLQRDSAA